MKGISRNVVLLGIVSLLTDASSQMVFPLIPLFLTGVLGTGALAVGVVEGAAETTASLLKVLSGMWSDRIQKRKPFVLAGYSASALAKPLFAFVQSWGLLLTVRVGERVGKGLRTAPRDAIIAESTDPRSRGQAYGAQRAMDGVGSVGGALAAYLLVPILAFRTIFLLSSIPAVLAVAVIPFVRERAGQRRQGGGTDRVHARVSNGGRAGSQRLDGTLYIFLGVCALVTVGNFGYAFLLLRATDLGLPDSSAILVYVVFYAVYTISSVPAGSLSDRWGRKAALAAGYGLLAASAVCLAKAGYAQMLWVGAVTYGLSFALTDGVQRAFVVDLAPSDLKATALGAFHTTVGLVALPAGALVGLLWDRIGPEATFFISAGVSLLALSLLTLVRAPAPGRASAA